MFSFLTPPSVSLTEDPAGVGLGLGPKSARTGFPLYSSSLSYYGMASSQVPPSP